MLAVILAGGSGSRLWPVSRKRYPKQFLSLNGEDSLLRETVERVEGAVDDVVVATNEDHYFYVRDDLAGLVDEGSIVTEPSKRDTAPAIALASLFVEEKYGDEPFLVLPSDHVLGDDFAEVARGAERLAEERLVTFGIEPDHAATGYGYVVPGEDLGEGFAVDRFVEKPGRKAAEDLIAEGALWNSGIFLFTPSVLRRELELHAPDLAALMEKGYDGSLERYGEAPQVSIDYAVMEDSEDAAVVPYSGEWRDIGNWRSVYGVSEKDDDGNVVTGDALVRDTEDTLVYGGNRLVAAAGLEDVMIVDTDDALLVASKERAEDVKEITNHLRGEGRKEAEIHTTVHRPWGYWTSLERGGRYQVKRLCIYPGESISLQRHHHRAEHWIVVKGTAKVTKGDEEFFVHENESTYVPKTETHQLSNPGEVDLHVVEIQTGEYLEEDDIERFDGAYERG